MVGTPLQFVKKSPARLDSHLFLKPSVVIQTAFIARHSHPPNPRRAETRRLPKLTRPTPANFFTANPPIALHSFTRAALLSQAPP
jgi:hypothetical protein